MEKTRLLELLKSEPSDIDAIGMILSNYTDYGHSELGGMVSVKKFNEVAECLLEWWDGKNTPTSQEQLATPDVSNNEVAVCDHKIIKKGFHKGRCACGLFKEKQ